MDPSFADSFEVCGQDEVGLRVVFCCACSWKPMSGLDLWQLAMENFDCFFFFGEENGSIGSFGEYGVVIV